MSISVLEYEMMLVKSVIERLSWDLCKPRVFMIFIAQISILHSRLIFIHLHTRCFLFRDKTLLSLS